MTPSPLAGLDTRQGRARIRRGLHHGTVTLDDILTDPPRCLHALPVADIVRWCRGVDRVSVWELNRHAIRDGVNLLVTVGMASERTRRWVLDHQPHTIDRHRPQQQHTCVYCGDEFMGHPLRRYCSPECRVAARRPVATERSCPECGEVFFSSDSTRRYCREDCRYEARRRRQREMRHAA